MMAINATMGALYFGYNLAFLNTAWFKLSIHFELNKDDNI